MSHNAPSLTLPLCAFAGFSPDTQERLEELFDTPPAAEGDLFRGFLLKPLDVANTSRPQEIQLLLENEAEGLRQVKVFSAPAMIRLRVATAGFLLANDPGVDSLLASMSITTGRTRHNRFAITNRGCISWRPNQPGCGRGGKAGEYQIRLCTGDAFLGYVADPGPRSAHAQLGDRKVLLPLAEDIYHADIMARSQRQRTGYYRKVIFLPDIRIRNSHMARGR